MRGQRELVASAAIPILVATIIWAPPWGFLTIVAVAATIAGDEYLNLARSTGIVVSRWPVLVLTVGLLLASWMRGRGGFVIAVLASRANLMNASLSSDDGERP